MSLYLLYEFASGYALFNCHGIDEIGQNSEAVRNSVADLTRFGKVVQLVAFNPFESALDALNQINAVSEGTLLFRVVSGHVWHDFFTKIRTYLELVFRELFVLVN